MRTAVSFLEYEEQKLLTNWSRIVAQGVRTILFISLSNCVVVFFRIQQYVYILEKYKKTCIYWKLLDSYGHLKKTLYEFQQSGTVKDQSAEKYSLRDRLQ